MYICWEVQPLKRRILSMLIVLILCVTLLPAGAKAAQINGDDPCYKYTPQIVEDVFRYLDEIYVQKYQNQTRYSLNTKEF